MMFKIMRSTIGIKHFHKHGHEDDCIVKKLLETTEEHDLEEHDQQ